MSAATSLRSEDQFLCSICLDLFTDPVSTPCGHNFCTSCITQHWDGNVLYSCPLCNEQFSSRPQLRINTFIKEMVDQFRHEAQQAAESGEVPCDVCTGTKQKALKSCLVCLASYCQTHLEPHLTAPRLKRHQLVDPVDNLEDRMCLKHDKPLELFCKTDGTCVCSLCPVLDHKTHEFVPLREEYEAKKAELIKTDDEVQQMIQNRQLKIQEIKGSLKVSKAESLRVFGNLMDSLETSKKNLMKEMEDQQKTTEKQAEDFIKDLEQEISQLMKRSSEVRQITCSEDHLHLLQNFKALKPAPTTKDWTKVRVDPPSYGDHHHVMKIMTQLLEDMIKNMSKSEAELKRAQQFEVDLTLDPDSAHPKLILSDDGKQVHHSDVSKELPDNPERFTDCPCVLGTQSFSSGRFYFQVQVKEKHNWILGVARKSINRKGNITASPRKGFWVVGLRNGNKYKAFTDPAVNLSLQFVPEKVGVFVDYQKGLVSFYNVEAAALIYSFTGCCFTEQLYPYFSPFPNNGGKNSSPLIICPVNQSA